MSLLTPATLSLAASGACVAYLLSRVIHSAQNSLPPGPRRWPLIGSALAFPSTHPWLTFGKWAKTYGKIIYLDIMGQPLVVVNSAKAARELLDQRSAMYSDRPTSGMAELSGFAQALPMKPYGDVWRQQRKLVAQDFSQSAITRYHSVQETEARKLVRSLLEDPSTLFDQLKLRVGTIIIRVTYGYYLTGQQDPFLTAPIEVMVNFAKATAPGTWIVDYVPVLRYLPRWTPGAGFLRTAEKWSKMLWDVSWDPYLWSKKNLETGQALLPNMCASVFRAADGKLSAEEEHHLVWATSAVLGGGLDTNTSTALVFFLAMMLNPAVQAKARQEIDDVIGQDRLPTIKDKPSLPYLRSIMTEVFRSNPPGPMGLPHALRKDDIYEGMHLPKGSLILPNIWYMLHDPEIYPNPDEFNPDRYNNLDSEMEKVPELVFGFGRRVCPGRFFAEGTFFAIAATVLATCEILPPVDSEGNKVIPDVRFSSGTITFPSAFEINLKCRTPKAFELLSRDSTDPN
ncbi:putative monooxygenase [Mycena maculata]|uniref:Monooxygenase n=1 Tax=Mycena maculata TaxID=230809 RepID=A0AAD7IM87_9AGAR|nr:putative monooxygenase [Mycena maculata]